MLIERIDVHLRDVQPKTGKRNMRKLHPSTIGYCERKGVFDMLMLPIVPQQARIQRVFDNGHKLHERFEQLFEDMGILIEAEKTIELDEISGRTDAWIKIDGKDYLVELKSASQFSFDWMLKKNAPKKEHVEQLMLYLHLANIQKGIILVENKDNQQLLEFHISYDPFVAMDLIYRVNRRIGFAKERKAPPIPQGKTPACSECGYCSYAFYCHFDSKKGNQPRHPIPFSIGSVLHQQVLNIINAIVHDQVIPDYIPGETNGELFQYVEKNCK